MRRGADRRRLRAWRPWKAALIAVGLPGLPLALLLLAIREPARAPSRRQSTGRFVLGEFATAHPAFHHAQPSTALGGARGCCATCCSRRSSPIAAAA